jgi:AcrR family transcriptional regulator
MITLFDSTAWGPVALRGTTWVSITIVSIVKSTRAGEQRPTVKQEQAAVTRRRIEQAVADLLHQAGTIDQITFSAVARQAGVTEMTVYRHFPTRDALLTVIWEQANRAMGPAVRMPENYQALLSQHGALFAGFDGLAPLIAAMISTPRGRDARAAVHVPRRKAFLAIVRETAPGLNARAARRAAAIIQLLHSAHAWASLREQWAMSGDEAAKATRWAIESLINTLRRRK